jgi:MFS family permease
VASDVQTDRPQAPPGSPGLGRDFTTFWVGQSISNVGTAITTFALPLIIFKLTGSAGYLAAANALTYLPFLLFGVFIGAWLDRTDRKRLMIAVNTFRGLLIASIAALSAAHLLSVWAVLAVIFAQATLNACYVPAQLSAVPSMVGPDDIVRANGRIQASFSAALIVGPALAGALITVMPVQALVLFDSFAYFCSVASLLLVRTSFDARAGRAPASMWRDVGEGVRYVLSHPVLRPLSIMTGLFVLVDTTTIAQMVLFGKEHFHVGDGQVGLLYTATGVGLLVSSLTAGRIKRHVPFSRIVLTTGLVKGLFLVLVGLTPWYWTGLVLWGLGDGATMLYNINTMSLRQVIVPAHLLGRVMSLSAVLSWSLIPLGSLLGGLAIAATGNVALVYSLIGVLHLAVAVPFFFTTLARAERYVAR